MLSKIKGNHILVALVVFCASAAYLDDIEVGRLTQVNYEQRSTVRQCESRLLANGSAIANLEYLQEVAKKDYLNYNKLLKASRKDVELLQVELEARDALIVAMEQEKSELLRTLSVNQELAVLKAQVQMLSK